MSTVELIHRLRHEQQKRTYRDDLPIKALRLGPNQWAAFCRELTPLWRADSRLSLAGDEGWCAGLRLYTDYNYDAVEVEYLGGVLGDKIVPEICEELGLPFRRI